MPHILHAPDGRIAANWRHEPGQTCPFDIVAPFRDGLLGTARLGSFAYQPHARLAAAAPRMAEAMDRFCDRVEAGEIRSKRTYAEFCEILGREPKS